MTATAADHRAGTCSHGDVTRLDAPRLLLAEDEHELATLLVELLTSEGYVVEHASDGHTALHLGLTRDYDVLVLDRGLPALEGVDLMRRLRGKGVSAPVLLLTAYDSVADRVEGLDAGAQDYLGKPFDVEELLARIRALLRRGDTTATPGELLDLGDRLLDVSARLVTSRDRRTSGSGPGDIALSVREADLLGLLATYPAKVFSRAELLDRVFPGAEADNAVDTYISYLRRKLGPEVVRTVRGVGYRMGRA
jgi:two-component system response regulator QseB